MLVACFVCVICECVLHAWQLFLCVWLCLCVLSICCDVCMLWQLLLFILNDCCESCICLVYVWCAACVDGCVLGCVCCMCCSCLVHICCMIWCMFCCVCAALFVYAWCMSLCACGKLFL